MDANYVPTLADAIKGYYEGEELIELCELFDVELKFEEMKPAHMRFARRLVTQIEHGNHRRFLEALVPSLLCRSREGAAHSKWDRQEYHREMVGRLELLDASLNEGKIPAEVSVQEGHPFTAKSEVRELLGAAETLVTIVDNYVGLGTLDCLRNIQQPIRLLTGQRSNSIMGGFDRGLKELLAEGLQIEVRQHHKLHDRYILFNDRCWLVGSSLKDAGKKIFNVIECVDIKAAIVDEVERKWSEATKYQV